MPPMSGSDELVALYDLGGAVVGETPEECARRELAEELGVHGAERG